MSITTTTTTTFCHITTTTVPIRLALKDAKFSDQARLALFAVMAAGGLDTDCMDQEFTLTMKDGKYKVTFEGLDDVNGNTTCKKILVIVIQEIDIENCSYARYSDFFNSTHDFYPEHTDESKIPDDDE